MKGHERWIVSDSKHLGGKPRIRGTRISVSFLLEMISQDMTIDEIVADYPSLRREAVVGTLQDITKSFDRPNFKLGLDDIRNCFSASLRARGITTERELEDALDSRQASRCGRSRRRGRRRARKLGDSGRHT